MVKGRKQHQGRKGNASDHLEDHDAVPPIGIDAEAQKLVGDQPPPSKKEDIRQRRYKRRRDHGKKQGSSQKPPDPSRGCVGGQGNEERRRRGEDGGQRGHPQTVPDQLKAPPGRQLPVIFQGEMAVLEKAGGHHRNDRIQDEQGDPGQHQGKDQPVSQFCPCISAMPSFFCTWIHDISFPVRFSMV